MERTRDPLVEPAGTNRVQPLRAVRIVQALLVVLIVVAAFITAPGTRPGPSVADQLDAIEQGRLLARFADAAAGALASLQDQDGGPFGSGYQGTDRGEIFAENSPNYDRSIAGMLVERGLLDAEGTDQVALFRRPVIAVQCEDRVAVVTTSEQDVPVERRNWWDEHQCGRGLLIPLEWPIYLALSDEPAAGN